MSIYYYCNIEFTFLSSDRVLVRINTYLDSKKPFLILPVHRTRTGIFETDIFNLDRRVSPDDMIPAMADISGILADYLLDKKKLTAGCT